MAKCLSCGNELVFDETYDEYVDSTEVILYEEGHCPECGKQYKWKDVYNFSEEDELREV